MGGKKKNIVTNKYFCPKTDLNTFAEKGENTCTLKDVVEITDTIRILTHWGCYFS